MEAINPIRLMLFWDSEIARDAYGPYFTGTVRKSWTIGKENIEILRYGSQYLECSNDDEGAFVLREMRHLWTIPADLSKEGIHILVEFEPIEQ
ncbi:hypothetical protein M9H77_03030 [Catharanthus roseus]|uniref:Uncharacterized protein n=1 Tax=Catharanthus roseus TaxID=4058 RepID=A0ACC0CA26_CATRO|nr:hypothetical protein M9H77_03030 [Catharanthus roseus]